MLPTGIDHPVLLGVVALICSPLLLPLARWFFDDFETFLAEIGYRAQDDIWWKLIRINQYNAFLWIKVVGFLGTFAIVVGFSYLSVVRVVY